MKKNLFNKKYQNYKKFEFSGEDVLYEDTLDFAIGDPDFHTDDDIIKYAFEQTLSGDTHYTVPTGKEDLKEAIIQYHKNRFNQEIDRSNIHITSSASHAMYLLLNIMLDEGDEVICFAPLFPNYLKQVELNNGTPVIYEAEYENNFQIEEDKLEALVTSKTKLLILNNPCNPSGIYYNEESYEAIYNVVKRHNLHIIADDIYTIFTYKNKFKSIALYKDLKDSVTQIYSFSKDFCMTGWRLGYIIGDPEVIKRTSYLNENLVYSPNTISQNAALYSLRNYEKIQAKLHSIYDERMNYANSLINKSKYFSCIPVEGTFYIFMNIEKTGLNAEEFSKLIYEKAHIKVFRGDLFGGEKYNKFVRLAINLPLEKINKAFDILEKLDYSKK